MSKKREIAITFVTDDDGTVASAINAVSHIADLTVTSKTLDDRRSRPAHQQTRPRCEPEIIAVTEARSHESELVYTASNPEAPHYRSIDIEASLNKLGLSREQLASQR